MKNDPPQAMPMPALPSPFRHHARPRNARTPLLSSQGDPHKVEDSGEASAAKDRAGRYQIHKWGGVR
jgi:hypothetical protein